MDFDSHMSDTVARTVTAVNLLTPGLALGKEYTAENVDDQVWEALVKRTDGSLSNPAEMNIEGLRGYAVRLRAVFVAIDEGRIDDACGVVNELLTETGAAPVLARHDKEPWHLHFHAVDAEWARSWAAPMATSLAVILGNPVYDRLGVCTASACDRVFVDTSRNGTRRFCSTACQNRVKAAAFRARKKN